VPPDGDSNRSPISNGCHVAWPEAAFFSQVLADGLHRAEFTTAPGVIHLDWQFDGPHGLDQRIAAAGRPGATEEPRDLDIGIGSKRVLILWTTDFNELRESALSLPRVTSLPSMRTCPSLARSSRPQACNSVHLPQEFGPTIIGIVPRGIWQVSRAAR
jgi:hypothetical protein